VVQLGVECYGGGLWHTWFDRDLSISGKVLVRSSENKIQSRLVQFKDPVARVSSLCIHLQSADERNGFAPNKEDHTSPIIGMALNMTTNATTTITTNAKGLELEQGVANQILGAAGNDPWMQGQEPLLLQRIAKKLDICVADIADFELNLYDTQPATIGGMNQEFLYSARLDNLATVFCAVEALMDHSADLTASNDIAMVVCFDHEEVGSVSATGAGSPVMEEAIRRVSSYLSGGTVNPDLHASTLAKSFIMSIDQAHAVHPNYASKHESQHGPLLNSGIVIKSNANQRYATNSLTGFVVRELARKSNTPIQEFCVRNDCPCGSTIGPTISARTGIRVVDAGMPQLSMHSIREVMGVADLTNAVNLFKCFFNEFRAIDDSIE
jgi:aspartyl aminopeptidase